MKFENKFRKIFVYRLSVFFLLLLLASCKNANSPVEPALSTRGQILSAAHTAKFSVQTLQQYLDALTSNSQEHITLLYDVEAFKVNYVTVDPEGNLIKASGAIFLPDGKNNLPLISLHHGTEAKRDKVASAVPFASPEGLAAASLGYFAVVPDYIGLGDSQILHPYHYEKSSADAVVDLIKAGREYARQNRIELNGQVFLAGYSEGGYVTLAAQKEIELYYSNEITLTASAPMAGAYDLNLTARTILQNKTYGAPGFLAYLIYAYDEIYGWGILNRVFNSPYAEKIPSLFNGTKSLSEINDSLTTDLVKLFNQNFVRSFLNGSETELSSALQENSLIDWVPQTQMRLYHGSADEYVPYQNSVEARDYFQSHGSNVELITIQGGTHVASALPSILNAIEWFESLRTAKVFVAGR